MGSLSCMCQVYSFIVKFLFLGSSLHFPQFGNILEIDGSFSLNKIFRTDCEIHQFTKEVGTVCASAIPTLYDPEVLNTINFCAYFSRTNTKWRIVLLCSILNNRIGLENLTFLSHTFFLPHTHGERGRERCIHTNPRRLAVRCESHTVSLYRNS